MWIIRNLFACSLDESSGNVCHNKQKTKKTANFKNLDVFVGQIMPFLWFVQTR